METEFYRLVKGGWGRQEWYGFFNSDDDAIAAFIDIFKDDARRDREFEKREKERLNTLGRKYRRAYRKKPGWIIERFGRVEPGVVVTGYHLPWIRIYVVQQGDDERVSRWS
jgi:hypothetical protein